METDEDIIANIKRVLDQESFALREVLVRVDRDFARAVRWIADCRGRVVTTGLGKSGLVARKIAATFSSVGAPSNYLHPVEALHGDIGMMLPDDLLLVFSNSGNTGEVVEFVQMVKLRGIKVIALLGHLKSRVGKIADLALDVGVSSEACILGLAPTCSSTAAMAVGDALAVAVSSLKNLTVEKYARLHADGIIGKKLTLRVRDVMYRETKNPILKSEQTLRDAILAMTSHGVGTASVIDEEGKLIGVVTDGDLRRSLRKSGDEVLDAKLLEVMTPNPKTTTADQLAVEAVEFMQRKRINAMPVVEDGCPVAMVHLHDLLAAGLVDLD